MRDLIRSIPEAEEAYQSGDYSEVVKILNTPSIKVLKGGDGRKPGFSSNATMGKDLNQAAVAGFLAAMEGAVRYNESLDTPEGSATGLLIKAFVARFNTTPDGIDFANEEIRSQLTLILGGAGLDPSIYLSLGYSKTSPSAVFQNKQARQSQVEEAYEEEKRQQTADRMTNALALFNERMTPDSDAGSVWSDAWNDSGAV